MAQGYGSQVGNAKGGIKGYDSHKQSPRGASVKHQGSPVNIRACKQAVQGLKAGPQLVCQGQQQQLDDDEEAPLPPSCFSMASPPHSITLHPPFYELVREKLVWCIARAPKRVLHILQQGVSSNFPLSQFLD